MKIYHTETQEDYDALMVELEERGLKWASGRKPTESKDWVDHKEKTGVVIEKRITRACIGVLKLDYPNIPITKYQAKAEDKMRFTKENVEIVVDRHLKETEDSIFAEIVSDIYDMIETPEKVVVPNFVADWIEWNKEIGVSLQVVLKCYERFYANRNPNGQTDGEKAVNWYVDNPYKFIQAYEDGYTIEPEQLYYIPLPPLETSDGLQQVLSKGENGTNYFASCPNENLKQWYTKEELEQVPEIYKPYAKLIEEEE